MPAEVFEDLYTVLNDVYVYKSLANSVGSGQYKILFLFHRYTALLRKSVHERVIGLVFPDKDHSLGGNRV